MYNYLTNCTESTAEKIDELVEKGEPVSYEELIEEVGRDQVMEIFPFYDWIEGPDLKMRDDYAVFYYKSEYEGVPAYYVEHSAIEYIFTLNN